MYLSEEKNAKARKGDRKEYNEKPNCAPYIPERERREKKKMKREEEREEKAIASLLGRAPLLLKNNRK